MTQTPAAEATTLDLAEARRTFDFVGAYGAASGAGRIARAVEAGIALLDEVAYLRVEVENGDTFHCDDLHEQNDRARAQVERLAKQRDTLAAALAALLRLDECPTTGPEYEATVEQAHAALATVTPTTGGAA